MLSQYLQIKRRIFALFLTTLILVAGSVAYISYNMGAANAQSINLTPNTITGGQTSGAPTYTVSPDGSGNYIAKDAYGAITTSTSASSLLNTIAAITPSNGGGPEIQVTGHLTCNAPIDLTKTQTILYSNGGGKLTFDGTNGIVVTAIQCTIKGLVIENVGSGYVHGNTGITFNSGSALYWERLDTVDLNGWATALYLNQAWESHFTSVTTDYSYNGLLIVGQSVNNFFDGCHFNSPVTNQPNVILDKDNSTGAQPESNNFDNCLFYGGNIGIQNYFAVYTQISGGCVIDGFANYGIYATTSTEICINGAYIGHPTSGVVGIRFDSVTYSRIVQDDLDEGNSGSTYGVYLTGTSTYNVINNNVVNANYGLIESGSSNYNIFDGNNISGATTAIGTVGGNSVRGTNIPAIG